MNYSEIRKLGKSQLDQDLYVLDKLGWKSKGFFVEAGACDGIYFSNTWLLEKSLDWSGICCEPNTNYFKQLVKNRECQLSDKVLYDTDDQSIDLLACGDIGGTEADIQAESLRLEKRKAAQRMACTTIKLDTLLDSFNAPNTIDYISLDTEGSELRILEAFSFSRKVLIWTIEHNTGSRHDKGVYYKQIASLMESHGYTCIPNRWDMYCVSNELLNS